MAIMVVWDAHDQDAGVSDDGVFGQIFSIDLFTAGDDMVYLPAIGPSGGWQALGGDDRVISGDSGDNVDGGAGVDEITGGSGNDWMWGGDMAGAGDGVKDTFFFGAAWGGDVIWNFENGSDMLDVSGAGISAMGQQHNATRPRIKSGEALVDFGDARGDSWVLKNSPKTPNT